MKQRKLYTRVFSAALALLLLFTATAGKALSSRKVSPKKPVAEQIAKKQQNNDERPVIQAMSLEAVVAPAISFDFEQTFYLLPSIWYIELPSVSLLPKRFDVFYYFFSFFRNVFGHFIASNAP